MNMDEKKSEEDLKLKIKIETFLAAKIPIHIILKKKSAGDVPRFLNGVLVGKKTDDVFIINERKLGVTYVLLEDIYNVTVFVKDNRTLADDFIKKNNIHLGEGVLKEEIDIIKEIEDS